ncbi:hypothetical protein [Amycolatopsis sp. SID8362]|uniref:hypothetical protein n=1 Tax=Amycolatopsis sp. SID8362 TaxID=2690346 RepID=UPI001371371B|nr:hypothetical protein [Amycolatopsis sp. SID8362]NBH02578.1 hypothetical protein [Amycolatopsis sp. SID8362]NED39280.1 hypothetical protein [Amycolatopsis sp. SID8362]
MTEESAPPWTLPRKPLCVNRVTEIDELSSAQVRAFANGQPMLVQLAGPRGIGKTTLAVELAYRFADDYPDGGVFLDARGSDPQGVVPAEDLARQLLSQLGTPAQHIPGAPEDRLATARGAVAGKRLIVVVDDVKLLAQLDGLFGDVSRSAIVVTSRSRLEALASRQQFLRFDLPVFDVDATAKLIEAIAPPAFAVPLAVVSGLRAKCAGLPLALAAGAGRITSGEDDPADFVAGLRLADLEQDGELSVEGVFDAIYCDLPAVEQADYRLLALIPGPDFGVGVAAAVLGCPDREARRRVAQLVRKYLLISSGSGRHRFHDLIREHAAGIAWAKSPGAAQDVVERATRWLAHRAVALDRAYARRPVPVGSETLYESIAAAHDGATAAAREFDVEWPNLVAAARSCADLGWPDLAIAVPAALYSFAYQTRRSGDLTGLYQRALDLAETAPVKWQLHRDLAGLHEQLGDGEEVVGFARAAAADGYEPGMSSAFEWEGLGHEQCGRLPAAKAAFREAIAWIPSIGDPVHEERSAALLRMHFSRVALKEGEAAEAEPELVTAAAYFAAPPEDAPNLARCEALLGDIARGREDNRAAETRWSRACAAYESVSMAGAAAEVLGKLAALADSEGRLDDARAYRARAKQLREDPQST